MENVLGLISYTPMVKLKRISRDIPAEIWAKLEFFNALSRSIKDRFAWYIIMKLSEEGVLKSGTVIYEASSGNFAIALSLLAKILGLNVRIYLPQTCSKTVERILNILGVEFVKTQFKVINREFQEFVKNVSRIEGALNINQFENEYNPQVHYEHTGHEIVQQLSVIGKKPDVLIASIGTGGHITGIAKKLREYYPKLKVIGVIPCKNNIIPGIKRIEYGVKWVHEVVDDVIEISVKEAIEGVIKLARAEGLLVGLSSGAVFRAFLKIREQIGLEKTYLLIFPDDIFKYLDILSEWIETFTDLST